MELMEFGHAIVLMLCIFVLPFLFWEAFKNRHRFLFKNWKNKKK